MKIRFIFSAVFLFVCSVICHGQNILKEKDQKLVIDSLISKIENYYIVPDLAGKIRTELTQNFKSGAYKKLSNPKEFGSRLTQDLLEVSQDLHFYVMYDPEWVEEQEKQRDPELEKTVKAQVLAAAQKDNFGFRDVEILEGNVGYLQLHSFHDPVYASETVGAVMQFLSNSDALIIDLRSNFGGVLEMSQLLSSYFFTDEVLPLYKFYYKEDKKRIDREQWVLPAVPGKRLGEIELYILTSSSTFSAAEWMSYSLKNHGRATIVGEQTAGGAHPVDRKILVHGFSANIPYGEIKDPITGEDFEGVGVEPDVKVPSKDALSTAHYLAVEKLAKSNKNSSVNYSWILPLVKNQKSPVQVSEEVLTSYRGKFGKGEILLEAGEVFYQWDGKMKFLMEALAQDLFLLKGIDDFRIKILTENGTVTGIKRIYEEGNEIIYPKE